MEPFETSGSFILPGDQRRELAGTLKYSAEDGVRLTVYGTLAESGKVVGVGGGSYPLIHGVLHSVPSGAGRELTLIDCFRSRISFGSRGTEVEEIVAPRAFVGDEPIERDQAFSSIAVEFSSLAEWLMMTGFKHSQVEGRIEVKHDKVEPKIVNLPGVKFSFGIDFSVSASPGEVRQTERSVLELDPIAPAQFGHVEREWLFPFAAFLRLATDEPSLIETCKFRLREQDPWPPEVHLLSRNLPRRESSRSRSGMDTLFTRQVIDERLDAVLASWLGIVRSSPRFTQLFFALLDDPPLWIDMRYAMFFEALELYARRCGGLEAFFGALPGEADVLLGNRKAFAERLIRAKEQLWEVDRPSAKELYSLAEAVAWTLKLALLKELQIPATRAAKTGRFLHVAKTIAT